MVYWLCDIIQVPCYSSSCSHDSTVHVVGSHLSGTTSRQGDVYEGSAAWKRSFQEMISDIFSDSLDLGPRFRERVIPSSANFPGVMSPLQGGMHSGDLSKPGRERQKALGEVCHIAVFSRHRDRRAERVHDHSMHRASQPLCPTRK